MFKLPVYCCQQQTSVRMPKKETVIAVEKAESSTEINGKPEDFLPPDGGLLAWVIVIASFLTNGIIFGIHNCYGIIYVHLKNQLEQNGVDGAPTKASLVGSLSIGMTFFISPLAGIMIDSFGLRRTAMLGGAIATIGMLASSFAMAHVEALYLTYGILFGAGTSLAYNPSLVILGHYFHKRLGLVNGLVTAGSSVFTITLPFFLDTILKTLGIEATLQVLAGIMALLMLCAITFVPKLSITSKDTSEKAPSADSCCNLWKKYINFSIWKNKRYIVWAIAVPTAMFGYFVPYVHLVAFVKDVLPDADGKMLVLCIGVTSGLGRLVFGKLGDLETVNRVVLQQIAFLAIGLFTMVLTLADSFTWFIIICLFLGLFDGCFVSLVGPIAFDLCGPKSSSQAIGFLLGLYAIPMTTGPTVAGTIYGKFGSYKLPFLLAGCPPILCALIMLIIHKMKNHSDSVRREFEFPTNTPKRKVSHLPDANGNKSSSSSAKANSDAALQFDGNPPGHGSSFQSETFVVKKKKSRSHLSLQAPSFLGSENGKPPKTCADTNAVVAHIGFTNPSAILW